MLIKCTNAETLASFLQGWHGQGQGCSVPRVTHVPGTRTSPLNATTSPKTHQPTERLLVAANHLWWGPGVPEPPHCLPIPCQVLFPSPRAGDPNPGVTHIPGQDLRNWACEDSE